MDEKTEKKLMDFSKKFIQDRSDEFKKNGQMIYNQKKVFVVGIPKYDWSKKV
jgi:hypothetical protein